VPKVQPIPSASSGRGKRGRSARVSTSLAEINVVPLVDVMLVLLIIFMVAAPMMTQGMQVNLPQAKKASNPAVQPNLYVTIPADFGATGKVQINNAKPPFNRLALLDTGPITNQGKRRPCGCR